MTFGNKLLLVIVVSYIQWSTLFASQALSKTSEDLCEDFRRQLSIDTSNTAAGCIEIEEDVSKEVSEVSEQELKNKVCEEQVLQTSAEVSRGTLGCNTQMLCELDHASQPKDTREMLFFNNDSVETSLNERSTITYDGNHQVELHNGKAACPIACCDSVKVQTDTEGKSYFIPEHSGRSIRIINPKITQIKVIRGIVHDLWIQVYLGYNPQLLGTHDEKGKLYGASILLVQSQFSPGSAIFVQRLTAPSDASLL
jgi:hypothetical protein